MNMPIINGAGTLTNVFALGDGSAGDPYRYAPMDYHDALVDRGVVFAHSERYTLANGATVDHLLGVPGTVHAELLSLEIVTSAAPLNIDFYEAAIVSANGTARTPRNLNRQSALGSACSLHYAPTVTDTGVAILSTLVSGDKSIGGRMNTSGRIILKANEKYLLRIQNASGGNASFALLLRWGED